MICPLCMHFIEGDIGQTSRSWISFCRPLGLFFVVLSLSWFGYLHHLIMLLIFDIAFAYILLRPHHDCDHVYLDSLNVILKTRLVKALGRIIESSPGHDLCAYRLTWRKVAFTWVYINYPYRYVQCLFTPEKSRFLLDFFTTLDTYMLNKLND